MSRSTSVPALVFLLVMPTSLLAGPNADGTLIVALSEGTVFTLDADYCGSTTIDQCTDAVTSVETPGDMVVVNILATFPRGSSPRLAGIAFGVEYDATVGLLNHRKCTDYELSDDGWPQSGTGTAATFANARETELVEIYWFGIYDGSGLPATFRLASHPSQGGLFADDSIPSILDPIEDFGVFGFNGSPGEQACPASFEQACCLSDGSCELLLPEDCDMAGGEIQGLGVTCSPNPCMQVGACCLPAGGCVPMIASDCSQLGGLFLGEGIPCEPDPCPTVGACCFVDGSCTPITPTDCLSSGGEYWGDGVPCQPNPCPQPSGACCFSTLPCELLTEVDCLALNGDFAGAGTACEPGVCQDPCVPFRLDGRQSTSAPPPDPGLFGQDPFAQTRPSSGRGPNAGGVLILHANPELEYSEGIRVDCDGHDLLDCESAVVQTSGQDPIAIFVLAAFSDDASPRVTAVSFGVEYHACIDILDWRDCGDFEAASLGWPESGTDTGCGWFEVQTAFELLPIYWFVCQNSASGSGTFSLVEGIHGTYFLDDSDPMISDSVADLGEFGFDTEGYLPCPAVPVFGACCFPDRWCEELTEADCAELEGDYQGDGTSCEDGCEPTPGIETTWGRIKSRYR